MRFQLHDVGDQPCRYGNEDGTERFEDRQCWEIIDTQTSTVAAQVFYVGSGTFELWQDGDMTECDSARAALDIIARAAPVDIFKALRVAGTLEALYQGYCDNWRIAMLGQPHGRKWMAGVVKEAGGLMRQSWPDLYADLGL